MNIVVAYLSVAVVFLAIDFVWLSTMAGRLYQPILGDILRLQPNLFAAGLFYVLYPLGLLAFAVLPASEEGNAVRALLSGLMFGFFTYATYDLTNQTTLRNWSTTLTVIDTCWGSFLAGICALLGYFVARRMGA